jgi:hypothetical protein
MRAALFVSLVLWFGRAQLALKLAFFSSDRTAGSSSSSAPAPRKSIVTTTMIRASAAEVERHVVLEDQELRQQAHAVM